MARLAQESLPESVPHSTCDQKPKLSKNNLAGQATGSEGLNQARGEAYRIGFQLYLNFVHTLTPIHTHSHIRMHGLHIGLSVRTYVSYPSSPATPAAVRSLLLEGKTADSTRLDSGLLLQCRAETSDQIPPSLGSGPVCRRALPGRQVSSLDPGLVGLVHTTHAHTHTQCLCPVCV